IIQVLSSNAEKGRALVKAVSPKVQNDSQAKNCSCRTSLSYALITAPERRDPVLLTKLSAVAGRVL
ncbi:MAG: 5'-methylthioadenosine phosphorylase, partial [Burkholderiaceae bacterium]